MRNEYSLRIFDKELLTFALEAGNLSGLRAEVISVNDAEKHLLPFGMETTAEGIIRFLRRRFIPRNRCFAPNICSALWLSHNDILGLLDRSKALSLNDSYWIVPKGSEMSFGSCNLYDNAFSEELARIAFTGNGKMADKAVSSPELTTGGALRKAWMREPDGIYLYKGGDPYGRCCGMEPYSEMLASIIAEKAGLHFVRYELADFEGIPASKCRLFTDKNTAFIPAYRLNSRIDLHSCIEFYNSLGDELSNELADMLVFDALICNEDRHFGNFGLLQSNEDGSIIGSAPIFDNGNAIFYFAFSDNYNDLIRFAKSRAAYGFIGFEGIVRHVFGKKQKQMLERLEDFSFDVPITFIEGEKLEAIEDYIRVRARALIEIGEGKYYYSAENADRENEPDEKYLEHGLPDYLKRSIEAIKPIWETIDAGGDDLHWDIYWCELNADINSAEVDRVISPEQAAYLRKKYLRMKSN